MSLLRSVIKSPHYYFGARLARHMLRRTNIQPNVEAPNAKRTDAHFSAGLRYGCLNAAAINVPNRDRGKVDAVQAAHVNRPTVEGPYALPLFARSGIAGLAKGQDSAVGTEEVLGGIGAPLIHTQLRPGCEQAEIVFRYAMNQCASFATDGAIANSDMIYVGVYFESDLSAVTATVVGFNHSV